MQTDPSDPIDDGDTDVEVVRPLLLMNISAIDAPTDSNVITGHLDDGRDFAAFTAVDTVSTPTPPADRNLHLPQKFKTVYDGFDLYNQQRDQARHCIGLQTLLDITCLLYTSPSPRDRTRSRMPSSA